MKLGHTSIIVVGLAIASSAWAGGSVRMGRKLPAFRLKDALGRWRTLKHFREPVIAVWYEGKNSKEQNRWLKKKMKHMWDKNIIPQKCFRSIGIANYQETAVPNWIIRRVIKSEMKKTGSVILSDETGIMMKKWGFRNGRSNIYVLDKERKLRWRSSGPLSKRRGEQLLRFIIRLCRQGGK